MIKLVVDYRRIKRGRIVILDVTCASRNMWKKNKHSEHIVFLDIRPEVKPQIVADNQRLPFREDYSFDLIVVDHNWGAEFNEFAVEVLWSGLCEWRTYTDRLFMIWGEMHIPLEQILRMCNHIGWELVRKVKQKWRIGRFWSTVNVYKMGFKRICAQQIVDRL